MGGGEGGVGWVGWLLEWVGGGVLDDHLNTFRSPGAVVKVNMDRLVLCEVAAKVLKQGFHIVGIDTVEKM